MKELIRAEKAFYAGEECQVDLSDNKAYGILPFVGPEPENRVLCTGATIEEGAACYIANGLLYPYREPSE